MRAAALAAFSAALGACDPNFDGAAYLITEPRVIAVQGEPAESLPGNFVRYRALVATPEGTDETAALEWSFCTEPKPITEDNIAGESCLRQPAANRIGPVFTSSTPHDACTIFGPDPPPGDFRPRDPDLTGGYYQLLLLRGAGPDAIAGERILCNLARASAALSREYRQRYAINQNPRLGALSFGAATLDALPAGAEVALSLALDAGAHENYVRLDPITKTIVEDTETLAISWFVNRGALETRRTSTGENILHTPAEPGPLHLWVVVRDSRGGTSFESYRATVR